jgi:GST-like protein
MFESGAILLYLAQKTGKLLPEEMRARYDVVQWLMFQMGGVGPMLGQAHHFLGYAPEKIPYAMDRYRNEANRLYGVIDRRLAAHEYLTGDYSIADIAVWPWLRRPERQGVQREQYPNFMRWFEAIEARPAVQRGVQVLAEHQSTGTLTEEARRNMFGDAQYARR